MQIGCSTAPVTDDENRGVLDRYIMDFFVVFYFKYHPDWGC
jgi:hypothetical protein